jgi:hypothetical protein
MADRRRTQRNDIVAGSVTPGGRSAPATVIRHDTDADTKSALI